MSRKKKDAALMELEIHLKRTIDLASIKNAHSRHQGIVNEFHRLNAQPYSYCQCDGAQLGKQLTAMLPDASPNDRVAMSDHRFYRHFVTTGVTEVWRHNGIIPATAEAGKDTVGLVLTLTPIGAPESPAAETPAAETPAAEAPAAEAPAAEAPVAETTVAETTVAETTVAETTVAETVAAEAPVAEAPVAEAPVVQQKSTKNRRKSIRGTLLRRLRAGKITVDELVPPAEITPEMLAEYHARERSKRSVRK